MRLPRRTRPGRPSALHLFALPLVVALAACGQDTADGAPSTETEATGDAVAFVGVNVVPMDAERILEGQTVVVRDGRIVEVGPVDAVEPPAGATLVEGMGRYLMPGLAEMHGHIPGGQDLRYAENVLFLYVSNGVTTVRGMAGSPVHLEFRDRVERGDLLGPTIHAAGPSFNGNSAPTPEAAEALARDQQAAGYDLVKVASGNLEAYRRLAEVAHEIGMPFAGHIPEVVGLEGAIEARQTSIDHLDRYVEFMVPPGTDLEGRGFGFFGSGVVDLADPDRIPLAVSMTREAGVWNVPTLSLVEHLASEVPGEEMAQAPEMQYMPRGVVDGWVRSKRDFQARSDFQPPAATRLVELRRELTKALHDGGAMIALGSDAPQFFNVPGFSIHPEMEMMVASGLTPYEVLVTGTRNPAIYFETPEDFGTVEVGRRADLILLDANPLDDIAHLRRRAGVMVRGQWLPEAEIQARLAAIADEARAADEGGEP